MIRSDISLSPWLKSNQRVAFLVICVGLELTALCYFAFAVAKFGRLPLPFFDDSTDTFMDFFNVKYWAANDGRYTEWHSLYSPLSFLLTKWINIKECGNLGSVMLRDCALVDAFLMIAIYVMSVIFVVNLIQRRLPSQGNNALMTALLVFFLLMTGPSLFAIERGNLVLITFAFFSLGVLLRSEIPSAFFMSLAILMKPYLAFVLLARLITRSWRYLFLVGFLVISINVLSGILLQDSNWVLIYENIRKFSDPSVRAMYELLVGATSYLAWVKVVSNPRFFFFATHPDLKMLTIALIFIAYIGVLYIFARIFYCLFKRYQDFDLVSIVFLTTLSLYALVDGLGYYSLILLYPTLLIIVLKGDFLKGTALTVFLVLIMLLILPIDIGIGPHRPGGGVSFISGVEFYTGGQVGLMSLMRPVVITLLMYLSWRYVKQRSAFANHQNGAC